MYDVIIVGAGPAGNLAALKLSARGHKVFVVDSRNNIGNKLCTGIIGSECASRFPPDASIVHHTANAATVVSPAGKKYRIATQDPQAHVIDRVAYVSSFAHQAMNAGAEYLLGSRVTNIEISDQKATVCTKNKDGRGLFQAKMAIIASGFGSPLLGMVGLNQAGSSSHMVGVQAEVETNELKETEVYLGEEISPGSFGWLTPLSDSHALIGMASRKRLKDHMDRFTSALIMKGKVREIIKEPRQWGIPIRPLHKTYANRVLVVGDAAGLVKPTTGGGIYYALLSGEISADSASESITTNDFSEHRLKEYQTKWKSLFGGEIRTGYYARMLYETLGDRQIENLLRVCHQFQEDLINTREFSFDWHRKVILKAMDHKKLSPILRSFGPLVKPFISKLADAKFL